MKRSSAMRVAGAVLVALLLVVFVLARVLPRGVPHTPSPAPTPVPRTPPPAASAPATPSLESRIASAEAALPDKPTPGRMAVLFVLDKGAVEPSGTLFVLIGKASDVHRLDRVPAVSTPVAGEGPFTINIRYDARAVKPGRGYVLIAYIRRATSGPLLYFATLPLDEEVPSGVEVMGQSR